MRLTFRYRLYPTPAQRTRLEEVLGAARWVYNKTLEVRRDAWQNEKVSLSRYDTNKLLTEWKRENEWLRQGHAQAMQDAQKRVDLAFRAFFRRVKAGEAPGYPRFRGRGRYDSFTYPQQKGNWRFIDDDKVRLSKVGVVKIKMHRPLLGEVKTLTIKRDATGNWYAMFSVIVEPQPLPPTHQNIGVDLGLVHFATLSNGEHIERVHFAERDAKDIARLQRKKERYPKGSAERRKVNRAIAKAYRRASNRRTDANHKRALNLIQRFDIIAVEDLDIADMQSNGWHRTNKGIADVAWNQFSQFLTYKAECAGRKVVKVNPAYTSQMCSVCGHTSRKNRKSQSVFKCEVCNHRDNADVNAAINILRRGLASLEQCF